MDSVFIEHLGHNGPCDLEKKTWLGFCVFIYAQTMASDRDVFTGDLSHPYKTLE